MVARLKNRAPLSWLPSRLKHSCLPRLPPHISKEPEGTEVTTGQLGLLILSGSHPGAG